MTVTQQQQQFETELADLPSASKAAIVELAIAHAYARDVRCDPWQFAVEISRLTDLGLTASGLRWLVEKGYVVHACEVTQPGDDARRFAPGCNTAFGEETRLLLTDSGILFAGVIDTSRTLLGLADQAAARKPWSLTCPAGTAITAPCTWASKSSSDSSGPRRIKKSSSWRLRKRAGPAGLTTRFRRRGKSLPNAVCTTRSSG